MHDSASFGLSSLSCASSGVFFMYAIALHDGAYLWHFRKAAEKFVSIALATPSKRNMRSLTLQSIVEADRALRLGVAAIQMPARLRGETKVASLQRAPPWRGTVDDEVKASAIVRHDARCGGVSRWGATCPALQRLMPQHGGGEQMDWDARCGGPACVLIHHTASAEQCNGDPLPRLAWHRQAGAVQRFADLFLHETSSCHEACARACCEMTLERMKSRATLWHAIRQLGREL